MNIKHTGGFILRITLYPKEHQVWALAQCQGVSGAAITDRFPKWDYGELVDEAIQEFCSNWVEKYKHSPIMTYKWVVAEEGPEEYVAISL